MSKNKTAVVKAEEPITTITTTELATVQNFQQIKELTKRKHDLVVKYEKLKERADHLQRMINQDETLSLSLSFQTQKEDWETTNAEFVKATMREMHKTICERLDEIQIEIELMN